VASLMSSFHFVPLSDVPVLSDSTPLRAAYSHLAKAGRGGFILERGSTRTYVKAAQLAAELLQRADTGPEGMTQLADESLGEVLSRGIGAGGLVPIMEQPVDVDADVAGLTRQPETVFRVVDTGKSVGWFLNHETVRDTMTQKTWWICAKGHRNPDPDHGTCYSCPGRIVRTEVGQ